VTLINPPVGNSSYEGGFVKVERRFSRGFALLAHYTFSKFLDDAASATEFGDPGSYMDAYNRRLDKGRSGSDVPHRASSRCCTRPRPSIRQSPTPCFGGWQIGLLSVLQSGQTFTVYDSVNNSNAFIAGPCGKPDRRPHGRAQSLNRCSIRRPSRPASAYSFGDSPRSALRGRRGRTWT